MGKEMGAVVVGTGFGCLTHLRALRAAGFDVVALVGRDPERTATRAKRFDVPFATTTLSEALDRPGADVVSIATPPHTHAAIVHQAVEAGRHVVCEKPFARDAAEARGMLAAAETAGVVHLLGTEFRFGTGQASLTRLVHGGAIGDPKLATFVLLMPLLAAPDAEVPGWWARSEDGGGWLGAHASHVIDQVRATVGEFTGVSASLGTVAGPAMSADTAYTVHFRAGAGVDGIMQGSGSTYGAPLVAARIAGTSGSAWLEGDTVWLADAGGQRMVPPPDDLLTAPADPPPSDLMATAYDFMHSTGIDMGPYTRLFEALWSAAGGAARPGHRPPPPDQAPATFADGVASMVVMDAIRRSDRERRWVDIEPEA